MTAKYDNPNIYNTSVLTYDGERAGVAGVGDKPPIAEVRRPVPKADARKAR